MTQTLLEKPGVLQNVTKDMSIGVYETHTDAETAVRALQHAGFDMKKLSIIGGEYHTEEHVIGYYNTGDRMQSWGKTGAFWGGIWGLLFGGAFFLIPGLGPILMAGPIVTVLVSALEGAVVVGGLGVLGGAMASVGVPENEAVMYETQIAAGKFLLFVHGTSDEINRAEGLLILSGK